MKKWNYRTRRYDNYEIPKSWNCKAYCDSMDEIVNCAGCGIKLPYGETYTSSEIYTEYGFGYGVCRLCKNIEINNRNDSYELCNY